MFGLAAFKILSSGNVTFVKAFNALRVTAFFGFFGNEGLDLSKGFRGEHFFDEGMKGFLGMEPYVRSE
jgi:hypothetical protein